MKRLSLFCFVIISILYLESCDLNPALNVDLEKTEKDNIGLKGNTEFKPKLKVNFKKSESLTFNQKGESIAKDEVIILKPKDYSKEEVLEAFSFALVSKGIKVSINKNKICKDCDDAIFIIEGKGLEQYSFQLSPGNGAACQSWGDRCATGGTNTNRLDLVQIRNEIFNKANTISPEPNKKILVAILDTGIDSEDAFIKANSSRILPGINVIDGSKNIEDNTTANINVIPVDFSPEHHGTKIAKIILNNTKKDNVKILPIKITNTCPGNMFDAICGIFTAMKHNANVLNLSWNYQANDEVKKLTMEVFKIVKDKNILVSTAAGNENIDITSTDENLFPVCFSERLSNITGVTSVALNGPNGSSYSIIENYSKKFVKVGIVSDSKGYFKIPNDNNSKGSSYATAIYTAYICNKLGFMTHQTNPENIIELP